MKPSPFEYRCPQTLDEAIALLAQHEGDAQPIAGGQSLMPMLAFRVVAPRLLVDINRIPGLARIAIDSDGITLGALVRWRDIERDTRLFAAHPLLRAGIAHVAHYQIRNRGTVGGSLAHADPAAEMPGLAVTCDAVIDIAGPTGRRALKATEFFQGPLTTALKLDELIVAVRLPAWKANRRWAFEEFARRRGDFALAGVALFYDTDASGRIEKANIGAIGIGDTPVRLRDAEKVLQGRAVDLATIRDVSAAAVADLEPPNDIHASADYRRALLATLFERALSRASGIPLPDEE